jgi:hypothetical protein
MQEIWVEKGFANYIKKARREFITKFWKMYPDVKNRVIAENILIAYDQMAERLRILESDEWHCVECDEIVPSEEVLRSKKGNLHKLGARACGQMVLRVE